MDVRVSEEPNRDRSAKRQYRCGGMMLLEENQVARRMDEKHENKRGCLSYDGNARREKPVVVEKSGMIDF